MSKTISLKSYAKTLMALTVIAAPIGETIAQTNKVPAEVVARRLANKKAKQQNPTAAAKKAKATGVQLYGYVLQSDERDPGLYKFTSNNAASISLVSDNVHCYNAATYVQGTYLSSWFEENDTQVKFPIHFYEYDTDTWQMKIDKPSPELAYSAISMDLTFDPETQQVYGLFSDDDYSGTYKTLGKLVTTYWGENDYTSNSETIGELPESMVAITSNKSGDLYTIGRSGKLYAVNKYSGAATVVGDTGYKPFKLFQSATCDYSTGKIYWAMLDRDDWATRIIEIDPANGKGTEVCNFIDNNAYDQITGLYIKQDLTLKAVPQTVSNLSVDLTGLTSGTVKFTMPTKDVKDVALSGSLKYTALEWCCSQDGHRIRRRSCHNRLHHHNQRYDKRFGNSRDCRKRHHTSCSERTRIAERTPRLRPAEEANGSQGFGEGTERHPNVEGTDRRCQRRLLRCQQTDLHRSACEQQRCNGCNDSCRGSDREYIH